VAALLAGRFSPSRKPPLSGGNVQILTGPALERLERVFWGFFVFAAAGGFSANFTAMERVSWLFADMVVVALVLLSPAIYFALIWRAFPVVIWAFIAIGSFMWSLAPTVSVYHGVQLLLTILMGFALIARLGTTGLAHVVYYALGISVALSLLLIALSVPGSLGTDGAWQGIYTHKNVLGRTLVLMIITAFYFVMTQQRPRFNIFVCLVCVIALVKTESMTSITIFAAVFGFLLFSLSLNSRIMTRLTPALFISGAAATALAIVLVNFSLVDAYLESTDKDLTFTGRTVLWNFAIDAFERQPMLGYGFKGYWESVVTTRDYLHFYVGQRLWFFHNNFLEVAVAFGIVGLVFFAWALLIVYFRAFYSIITNPSPINVWVTCILIQIGALTLSENPLFENHGLFQVLFAACYLHFALQARASRATEHLEPARQ
jgi:O-antigen ligase